MIFQSIGAKKIFVIIIAVFVLAFLAYYFFGGRIADLFIPSLKTQVLDQQEFSGLFLDIEKTLSEHKSSSDPESIFSRIDTTDKLLDLVLEEMKNTPY